MNGLLRDYIPNRTGLRVVTADNLALVVAEIDTPPRKVLGWAQTAQLSYWPPTSPDKSSSSSSQVADERSLDDTLRTALNMPWGVRLESLAELTPTAQ